MKYTLEETYLLVGREDKTAGLTLRYGSDSFKKYGEFITVVFLYTQKEREEMDKIVQNQPFKLSGLLKARALVHELDKEKIKLLETEGIHSDDIVEILYFTAPQKNTFHSKEKRTIKKLTIPMTTLPKGRDLDWMYGFSKRLVKDDVGLSPQERAFYLAGKFYYEQDALTDDEINEIFPTEDSIMAEEIEQEFLGIKYMREEISEPEKKRAAELIGKKERHRTNLLDKYLQQAGSSLKKLATENIDKAVELFSKVSRFKDRRLNALGKLPIFIDLDSFLHIYMRHVEEMQVNAHFEHKDNFQWNEEDVLSVMEHVIEKYNSEIQDFFSKSPDKRYSRYGSHSAYYQGDYYTFHIEPTGRVSTFHKNKKEQEKKKDG